MAVGTTNDGGTPADGEHQSSGLPQENGPHLPTGRAQSEWTVSDRRGPLSAASEVRNPGGDQNPDLDVEALGEQADEPAPVMAAGPQTTDASSKEGPAPDASPLPPRSRPAVPLLIGLLLGAVIGAGSAALVYLETSHAHAPGKRFVALSARVDALERGQSGTASKGGAAPSLGGDVSLAQKVAGLQAKIDALTVSASGTQPASADDPGKVQAGLDGLDRKLAEVQRAQTDFGNRLDQVQGRDTAAQAGFEALQASQRQLETRVNAPALAVVADSLSEQVELGRPYVQQVDALTALNADPAKLAVLKQEAAGGVPSAQVLLGKFRPLIDPVLATERKAHPHASFGEKLKQGLVGLVTIRRVDDTSGSDLPSRVSLIEADLAHNDVAGAYSVWNGLPPDAKQASQSWGALAKTSVEAITAAHALRGDAIAALGAKRS